MSLPRYPEYKDSGVAWLGDVPGHWGISTVKRLALRISSGKTPLGGSETYVDDGVLFLRSQNVYDEGLRLDDVVRISEEVDEAMAVSRVRPGDILLNITGASIGRSCLVPGELQSANVNQHVCAIRLQDPAQIPFVGWVFKSRLVKSQIGFAQNGAAREGLNFDQIGRMVLALAPLREQHVIATFLDRETAKIDTLIAEQEKLLALLAEKRQATISHAVTRGLNPSAPMKDSGIPWLGEAPAHWDVRPLKSILTTPITDGPHETPEFLEEGVPFVSAEAVSGGSINFERIRGFISQEDDMRYASKYRPQIHDIYMVKSGATTGVTAIVEDRTDFSIWSPLAAIRCDQALAMPHFVLQFLRSKNFQEGVALHWSFGTQQNIGMGVLGDLPVLVPPMPEQESIVKLLTEQSVLLDSLRDDAEESIRLLRERRSALISAAVTGKIDVRNAA